ncbi:MAG: methyltransferase domain-containing protein, partial [Candidatus Hydrogenedentes bacterium]|nr:methyltransferase domain-containing protein [Candidatus Hydrogenedentota bacterium]
MDYTGERCIPGKKGLEILELEHRARYACAAESVAGKRVLDLGSGAGYGSAMLGERAEYVLGFDISKEAVRYAKGAYSGSNVDFHIGNVCAPGFVNKVQKLAKEPFDCVTCFEVIEHVAEPLTLLAHVKSLLRPEGVFFISTPNIDYPYESGHDNPHHVTEYSLEEFEKLLSARFENIVIAEQQLHLLSSIGFRKDESQPLDEWRNYRGGDAKYFVAACSDVAKSLPELNKLLVTSDANVRLLQERLRETRQDQAFKGQRIALLDRHIKDLQSTGLEAEVAASRIANEKAQAELLYLRERDSKNRDEYQAQVKQLEERHAEAQAELE